MRGSFGPRRVGCTTEPGVCGGVIRVALKDDHTDTSACSTHPKPTLTNSTAERMHETSEWVAHSTHHRAQASHSGSEEGGGTGHLTTVERGWFCEKQCHTRTTREPSAGRTCRGRLSHTPSAGRPCTPRVSWGPVAPKYVHRHSGDPQLTLSMVSRALHRECSRGLHTELPVGGDHKGPMSSTNGAVADFSRASSVLLCTQVHGRPVLTHAGVLRWRRPPLLARQGRRMKDAATACMRPLGVIFLSYVLSHSILILIPRKPGRRRPLMK
jgi:hypothetical protein